MARKVLAAVFVLALCAMPMSAQAACDVERGAQIAANACAACHGKTGNEPIAGSPKIAGQHYDYLLQTINEYIEGKRGNPVMTQNVRAVIDSAAEGEAAVADDLCALAEFYARQSGDLR